MVDKEIIIIFASKIKSLANGDLSSELKFNT